MLRNRKSVVVVTVAGLLGLTVAACGSTKSESSSTTGAAGTETTAAGGAATTAAGGAATTAGGASGGDCIGETGCVPAHQPDVNQDGTVTIGVLSPGDTNDHGYYESFVVTARKFAEKNGWKLITVDKVNPADALDQARNLCRQKVDMVAIAASELKDAIPAAQEDVCKGTVWYVAGGQGITQTPYFFQSNEPVGPTQYITGYAAGLVLKELGGTKLGYITGPELDFAKATLAAVKAGLKSVIPDGDVSATYTGDFNDSALGQEAARAQISKGAQLLYPYLGGATDAVAAVGAERKILSITPGTDRCSEKNFAISSVFSPGDYFAAVLQDFEAGKVALGVTRTFNIGVDPVPTVIVCDNVPNADKLNAEVKDAIAKVVSGEIDVKKEIAAVG